MLPIFLLLLNVSYIDNGYPCIIWCKLVISFCKIKRNKQYFNEKLQLKLVHWYLLFGLHNPNHWSNFTDHTSYAWKPVIWHPRYSFWLFKKFKMGSNLIAMTISITYFLKMEKKLKPCLADYCGPNNLFYILNSWILNLPHFVSCITIPVKRRCNYSGKINKCDWPFC